MWPCRCATASPPSPPPQDIYKLTKVNCAQPTNFFSQYVVSMTLFIGALLLGSILMLLLVRSRLHHTLGRKLDLMTPGDDDYRNEEMWGVAVAYAQRAARARGHEYSSTQAAQVLLASRYDETRSSATALLILLCILSYTPVSVRTVSMFVCQDIEGVQYLVVRAQSWTACGVAGSLSHMHTNVGGWAQADATITCTGVYFAYAGFAALVAIVYVIGLPAFLAMYLVRNRVAIENEERWILTSWGTVYDGAFQCEMRCAAESKTAQAEIFKSYSHGVIRM